ncbi:tRNA synthetase RNA-binding protein [Salipiger aestuarii]|uniref:Ribosome-associated heat shock protein Hsp15 n=1 Tax=Salipiger aestuarii TaxID=568098 RepID=A0A327YAF3_9RHOB|nr:RNA-binding S4 domain-containing protein [Salipiger aestuarii]EIE50863.1 S4 domain-containing protein [Citreicella sp. 357]KAB2541938.1 tRNA synthetase RNA-binding protein [Salipiger aestuarii]RAK18138.1 ribosome-associated heat shock protein Hsp15 [Salipiger aestuarii]
MTGQPSKLRIDKWLWHARFFRTRSLAARVVGAGLRVNGQRIAKPAFAVGPGDVLTFGQERDVRVIRVVALGTRRGPAPEAQALYEDLDPPQARAADPSEPRAIPGGRPTKRDRRVMDRRRDVLE